MGVLVGGVKDQLIAFVFILFPGAVLLVEGVEASQGGEFDVDCGVIIAVSIFFLGHEIRGNLLEDIGVETVFSVVAVTFRIVAGNETSHKVE